MAAKLGNLRVFRVKKARGFPIVLFRSGKGLLAEIEQDQPFRHCQLSTNRPFGIIYVSKLGRQCLSKNQKIVSIRYVLVHENFFFYGLGFRG
jgi:hypothetical protein